MFSNNVIKDILNNMKISSYTLSLLRYLLISCSYLQMILKILQLLLTFLCTIACSTAAQPDSKCVNVEMAKAETYLETAAAIIDRLRENLPEGITTFFSN